MCFDSKIKRGLEEGIRMRHEEQKLLNGIAASTSLDFAERAADALDGVKRPYSFGAYLGLLERLHALVSAGVSGWLAIEIVQTCDPSFDDILLSRLLADRDLAELWKSPAGKEGSERGCTSR